MVLTQGKKAPSFTLEDKEGVKHSLSDISTEYTVLFFYPKDNTPGCSIESKQLSDALPEFAKRKATVIGISGGDQRSKTKFCDKLGLKQVMLSDTDFAVSTKYGVYGEKKFMGKTYMGISRVSFVLDKSKKILKVFENVKPISHSKELLDFLDSLQ